MRIALTNGFDSPAQVKTKNTKTIVTLPPSPKYQEAFKSRNKSEIKKHCILYELPLLSNIEIHNILLN